MFLRLLLPILVLIFSTCAPPWRSGPDTIYYNGTIYTIDSLQPLVTAMAVREGRVLAIGGDEEIRALAGTRTELVDLNGQFVMPGLIEGHGHFRGIGGYRQDIALLDIRNWSEALDRIAARVAQTPSGQWITGRGWHQEKWNRLPDVRVAGYPTHQELSALSPEHPVLLKHASGHSLMANLAAMRAAGIDRNTPDPPGGRIIRDRNGEPAGVFEENAMDLITRAHDTWLATRPEKEVETAERELLRLAQEACLSLGITSFQDAGSTRPQIERLRVLVGEGFFHLRLWVMLNEPWAVLPEATESLPWIGLGDDHLTVRAIKTYIDGALGSHGAWLLEPYSDQPGFSGQNVTPPDTIEAIGRLALEQGLQLCVHAIGDRANREVLDICQRIFSDHPEHRDTRWRIEHAQHLDSADIPRFRELGVIASMQPVHCISDAPFVEKRLGPSRAGSGAYVWRSLLDNGAMLATGTDAPVESVDPFANIYAAVTRKRPDTGQAFYPGQAMDRREVLYSYTLGNALAAFEEKSTGSISPGKWADFIILSQDITRCPDEAIPSTRVLATYIAGRAVYRASGQ
jgi:predicted amidohydrolase YtcJ